MVSNTAKIVKLMQLMTGLSPSLSSQGVDSFDVSLENQTVVVHGTAPYETVLEKIKKTGKEVKSGQVVA